MARHPLAPSSAAETATRNAKLDKMCEAFCFAVNGLSTEACPNCGQKTLEVEITLHSGVVIFCGGLDQASEDGQCEFERIALISQYRMATVIEMRPAPP